MTNDLYGAIADLNRVIELDSTRNDIYFETAKIKSNLNLIEDSEKDFNKWLSSQSTFSETIQ